MNADDFETLTYQLDSVQGKNLYQYCFNNPVNMEDEDGGWPKWVTQVLVGTAVIAAAAALTVATAGTGTALAAVAVGGVKRLCNRCDWWCSSWSNKWSYCN